jgi:hypothetical protein
MASASGRTHNVAIVPLDVLALYTGHWSALRLLKLLHLANLSKKLGELVSFVERRFGHKLGGDTMAVAQLALSTIFATHFTRYVLLRMARRVP